MHKDGTACSHEWPRSAHIYRAVAMLLLPLLAGVIADAWWGTLPLGVLPAAFPWAGAGVAVAAFGLAYLARPRSLRQ
jgi:hypothetical protein